MIRLLKNLFRDTSLYQQLHKKYRSYVMRSEAKNYPAKRKEIIANYSHEKRYLNVGDGRFAKSNWRLLDYAGDESNYNYTSSLIDYDINLLNTTEWPIENSTFEIVYSSHCLEHLTMGSIKHAFREIYRILKPNGVFRLTVPDTDLAYEAFSRNDLAWFENNANAPDKSNINTHFLNFFSSKHLEKESEITFREDFEKLPKEVFLNKYIVQKVDLATHKFEYHVSWINFDLVNNWGNEIGFTQIIKSSRGQSILEELRNPMFDHKPGEGNLYVDLIK